MLRLSIFIDNKYSLDYLVVFKDVKMIVNSKIDDYILVFRLLFKMSILKNFVINENLNIICFNNYFIFIINKIIINCFVIK